MVIAITVRQYIRSDSASIFSKFGQTVHELLESELRY
jgi:hypothetical protein